MISYVVIRRYKFDEKGNTIFDFYNTEFSDLDISKEAVKGTSLCLNDNEFLDIDYFDGYEFYALCHYLKTIQSMGSLFHQCK